MLLKSPLYNSTPSVSVRRLTVLRSLMWSISRILSLLNDNSDEMNLLSLYWNLCPSSITCFNAGVLLLNLLIISQLAVSLMVVFIFSHLLYSLSCSVTRVGSLLVVKPIYFFITVNARDLINYVGTLPMDNCVPHSFWSTAYPKKVIYHQSLVLW